jgi:hypothetical protein
LSQSLKRQGTNKANAIEKLIWLPGEIRIQWHLSQSKSEQITATENAYYELLMEFYKNILKGNKSLLLRINKILKNISQIFSLCIDL